MSVSEKEREALQAELKWINLEVNESPSFTSKVKSKGVLGVLVPLGCVTTIGVLATGLYHMFQKDKRKQQIMMRYRVLAQGITLCLAVFGILTVKSK